MNKEPHELSSILCEVEGREGVGLVIELSPQKLGEEHDFLLILEVIFSLAYEHFLIITQVSLFLKYKIFELIPIFNKNHVALLLRKCEKWYE